MAGCRAKKRCEFGVGFEAFLLVIFTALLLYAGRKDAGRLLMGVAGFLRLVFGLMVEVNRSIVSYNLHGAPMQLGGMLIASPIAAILLIAIYITSKREPPLATGGGARQTSGRGNAFGPRLGVC